MKIALIGASGFVGKAILKEAVSRGWNVTAIVRHPEKVEKLPGVTAKQVDVNDVDALAKALSGHDVIVSSFNGGWGDPDIYNKHLNGSRDIVKAAKAAKTRLIVIGGAGSLEAAPGVQIVDTPEFPAQYKDGALAARDALNEIRQEKGLDWSFLSPAILLAPGARTGKFRYGEDKPVFDDKGESRISVEDLAVAIADEAETGKHTGKRFTVGY
ncbi:NAD(P)-dependent oxidoreductase [Pseudaminobacter soli (ex Li et al. 2025)]|uniref:3-beta hydroxysteroid dehydrogenase n=1 Tax=Pseudaminobacter soli (ex Li et al. 2025) TaxID=1295366 RepID=A0A2P7SAZ2_9HYPH|nr:NAD(P)-dependent oxidoreductase [Mesorhizobium soli]PSJ59673.1 3-beta hydroxysteroid dehydrogenase [Mesorhizobium soli]